MSAGLAAQDSPRFRAGVDLITLEVRAVDARGRPVEDLTARDFIVRVDGKTRDVASAQFVRADASAPAPAADALPELVSTNVALSGGRRVAVAVDQTLITPGSITPLLHTAARFVDGLLPSDHVTFVAFPEPGPRVDFTRDKARVRDAMQEIVGQPRKGLTRSFDMSLTESLEIDGKEKTLATSIGSFESIWATLGPSLRRVLERGCRELTIEELALPENGGTFSQCVREVINEAIVSTVDARTNAGISLAALERLLSQMALIEGPKALVMFSAGLLVEDPAALDRMAQLAAEARTSISVIAVEPDREQDVLGLPSGPPTATLRDRSLELEGLDRVADRTGGRFVRVLGGNGQGVFDQLATELSAWYVVAVERRPGDPDRQRVEVEVRRRGVAVRSARSVVATAAINARRPREELLRDAMASPIPVPGLPLRVSTLARRDVDAGKVRLHVTSEIGEPGIAAGEFAVGYVVINERGDVVASFGRRLPLAPPDPMQPLFFDTALALPPGVYSLRFGAVDPGGRRGTIVRHIDLTSLSADGVQTSDLIVGEAPVDGAPLRPAVEPRIRSGRLAGYLEVYVPDDDPGGLRATVDIAEGEHAPALVSHMLNMGPGAEPSWRVVSGAVDAALLPGRYVARVTLTRGAETIRVLWRPFVLERPAGVSARSATAARSVAIPPELQRRTAAYVATVVGSLANVVGQEEFTLSDPDRRVRSEFLLVRYPGSMQDLLPFRDVTHVDGMAVGGRDEHLVDLFLKPADVIRDRVRQITLAAETHVPSTLNPIFALAFLQGDFQSRFTFTVSDAGAAWPREVRAVAFVETARPTLLRAGPFGDLDVPTRGTAWVEDATGRILQTELQMGQGRSAPRVVTRFTVDPRLQIMVPVSMRSENPSGTATYSNFRRFTVQTDSATPVSQRP
jgi:VWFA-related protein